MNEWVGSGLALLAEWSLPNPEVHSSNPGIRKSYIEHLFTFYFMEKTKIKKKRDKCSRLDCPKQFGCKGMGRNNLTYLTAN